MIDLQNDYVPGGKYPNLLSCGDLIEASTAQKTGFPGQAVE